LNRIEALKQLAFTDKKLDIYLTFNSINLTYITGFSGATALITPEKGESTLFVGGVNYEQAKEETKGLTVELLKQSENLFEKIASQTAPIKPNKYAVDALSIEAWRALAKAVGGEEKLQTSSNIVREMRKIKDQKEIQFIREACKFTDLGMQVAAEILKPGVKEKEVAAEVEYAMRKKGSDGTAFETIVASGVASAFPHGSCSERTIREGDLVVVDLGAICKFYRSDLTRTFSTGKPSEKQNKIYDIVKLAQETAFKAIKPKAKASEVDMKARQVIETAGYGEYFVHNLGHGVGLEIHEPPVLSPDSKDILATGNVVTDEPGIYLPGHGGVRIEDTVLVTEDGAEKLTVAPCNLSIRC